MSVHKFAATRAVDPVREARIHLAAAHRLAVLDDLEEGIDNHFTVLAMGTGKPLEVFSDEVVAQVQSPPENDRHSRTERERLYFEAMMRVLDRENPGYAD